ncbi:lytic polysaccharide monooxygenase auxiliary activity family 9 protein [Streptomyces sp. WMMC940]|uniref:lytic polysaccharide monooxygenase auxiliary activity family 9 protein n=1 Tax=Streptomyces sp. WMMC940 TaxID=3015153 RepID=UPI0022B6C111|nr:lytic polysaccharide monooxygenase [Streptomyces sp. WMMC940]MCZ7461220.1 lytic polysaccharide monooxygenase [Streptomyces sp. WMMC940]
MTARRRAATVAALGIAPLALTALAASPAVAHGSMTDPVSRVSACYAEGPESPKSAACKAAIAASGTQAFYDWNEVNIADAAGNHRSLIPDGKLCSANRDKYKGLDLPRTDWPASRLTAGNHTFRYKATAPHKGSFELYITKDGYDPSKPLTWSDLEARPFAEVADPKLVNGEYVFDGNVPARSGRHLVYSIWQRSDSPEAFYTCSDVVFGQDTGGSAGGGAPAPTASAPSDEQIEDGADKSTVDHGGHGGDDHSEAPATDGPATPKAAAEPETETDGEAGAETAAGGNTPEAAGAGEDLAETGGDGGTPYLAAGGAAVLALGAAVVFATARRRADR